MPPFLLSAAVPRLPRSVRSVVAAGAATTVVREKKDDMEQTLKMERTLKWDRFTPRGSHYWHASGLEATGLPLAARGERSALVAVRREHDFRLKLFLDLPPGVEELGVRLVNSDRTETFHRDDDAATLWEASFPTADALARAMAQQAPRTVPPEPSADARGPVPERDRSAVPLPSRNGPQKFPRALLTRSKRHDCLVMSRWVGRIPPQFHRDRRAPVLECVRETVLRAYGSHVDRSTWRINGKDVTFRLDPDWVSETEDRFLCELGWQEMHDLLTYQPPVRRWQPPQLSKHEIAKRIEKLQAELEARGGYLDVCVETVFRPDPRGEHLPWRGDTEDWPEWMEARSVMVTPPQTSGGWHVAALDAPGIRERGYPTVRLNGVWMVTGPWSGDRVSGYCDSEELAEIRQFGRTEGEEDSGRTPPIPNEPARIRTIQQAAALNRLLRRERGPGLPHDVRRKWRDAAMALNNSLGAMMGGQGQVDYNVQTQARCVEQAAILERRVQRLYARRKPAYAEYDREAWLAEQEDGEWVRPRGWTARAKALREHESECGDKALSLARGVQEAREKYDAAVAIIEGLEDEWADLVECLYPAPRV